MKISVKELFVRLVFICNIGCILLLLLSDLSPYANPSKYWPVAIAGILFPILLVIIICFIVFWTFVKRKNILISLLTILISIPNIISTFAFNFSSSFIFTKSKNDLRVLTWNVGLMNYEAKDSLTNENNNAVIFSKIKESNADIICLQEFFTSVIPGYHYNFIERISATYNYPYTYFSKDISKFDGKFYTGTIIFSRYKVLDTQKIAYPNFAGSIIKADILKDNDTIDVYTTRFQSVKFQQEDYKELNNIKSGSAKGFAGSKSITQKLVLGYNNRVQQIAIAKEFLSQSKRPVIFTGDFNDVPISYTYANLKKGMSDAWIKKGVGLGRTFEYISPTLRIDNIFYNNYFKAVQVKRIITDNASDHYGLLADLSLK